MFGFKIIKVTGHSMEPTIKDGAYVLIKKLNNYSNGDIIAFRHHGKTMLKRLISIDNDSAHAVGDNLSDSLDSRQLGSISISAILGKAILW